MAVDQRIEVGAIEVDEKMRDEAYQEAERLIYEAARVVNESRAAMCEQLIES